MLTKGVSPVIGLVIILAVTIIVSIAFSLYSSFIAELFTSPIEEVRPRSALKVYANQFEIVLHNDGTVEEIIDKFMLSQKEAKIYRAVNEDGSSVLQRKDDGYLIILKPGDVVTVRGFMLEKLELGAAYEIRLHTTSGKEFFYPVRAQRAPFETGLVGFNTGIKDPRDPSRRIVLFAPIIENVELGRMEVFNITFYNGTFESVIYNYRPDPPIIVEPKSTYKPSSWRGLLKVGLKPGTYFVKIDYRVGNVTDYLLTTATVDNRTLKVYVIYITVDDDVQDDVINEPYPGWSVDIRAMISRLSTMADVEVIDSMSKYKALILGSLHLEEPYVVINIHSEPVPVPIDYIDEQARNVRWHEWFEAIRNFISSHKVIWVNPSGYPFWGIANKRMARKYGYPAWTSSWGRNINRRSLGQAYTNTGGATNLCGTAFTSAYNGENGWGHCGSSSPTCGVTYNGFVVVSNGSGTYCARTWNYHITGTDLVSEFNEFFQDFGISLPAETTGWDVPKVLDADKKYYLTSGGIPTVYAISLGEGYLLVVGLPPSYNNLSVDMSLYLSIHIILFEYEIPSYILQSP